MTAESKCYRSSSGKTSVSRIVKRRKPELETQERKKDNKIARNPTKWDSAKMTTTAEKFASENLTESLPHNQTGNGRENPWRKSSNLYVRPPGGKNVGTKESATMAQCSSTPPLIPFWAPSLSVLETLVGSTVGSIVPRIAYIWVMNSLWNSGAGRWYFDQRKIKVRSQSSREPLRKLSLGVSAPENLKSCLKPQLLRRRI